MFGHRLRAFALILLVTLLVLAAAVHSQNAPAVENNYEFNDAHFHLTGHIQEGTPIRDIIHNDVDRPFADPEKPPAYLDRMKALHRRHPRTTIIWAHTGLGRVVRPINRHAQMIEDILTDPGMRHVMFHIYDDSGKWLFATGLPAKTGVGGGLIAVSPGKFGIAVISPPLDPAGNSVRAQKTIADISAALHGNPYVPETATRRTN